MDRTTVLRVLRLALAVFSCAVMFAWSNIPPYRGNVLEEKRAFFVWHWQLYSRGGEGICDVRYFDQNNNDAPIERWTLLGFERPRDMPDKMSRTTKDKLLQEYRRVCAAQRKATGQDPHIEVFARCADHGAWKRVENRKRDVCSAKQVKNAGVKPKPKPKPKPGSDK